MITTNWNSSYDVVVIGGGPAGATLATILQREGYRCLILERSTFPRYHVGESLIPHTFGIFERIGLLPKIRDSHFPEKNSVRFISEDGKESAPFYFKETIEGEGSQTWQVERSEFDQICLDHARENGVEVLTQTSVEKVLFDEEKAEGVRVVLEDGEIAHIQSKVVVDASGRTTLIGSQLGLRESVEGLEKASLWTYFRGGERLPGIDAGETTIFMMPDRGWFWYIPLPDDRVSVGIVSSKECLIQPFKEPTEAFHHHLERCTPLAKRLEQAVGIEPVRGIGKLAYRNRKIAGPGWVMIGDAAAFLDPIYSSGLFLALASAELAAESIGRALAEDDLSEERIGAFVPSLSAGVDIIKRLIFAFYDPTFSFKKFADRFPEHRKALIDCLVGDVINKDMTEFVGALEQMVGRQEVSTS